MPSLSPAERERMVRDNVKLVHHFIRRAGYSPGDADYADVLQEGLIAVWRATDTFDPAKGKFSTHAGWAIRAAVSAHRAAERRYNGGADRIDWPSMPDADTGVRVDLDANALRGRDASFTARDFDLADEMRLAAVMALAEVVLTPQELRVIEARFDLGEADTEPLRSDDPGDEWATVDPDTTLRAVAAELGMSPQQVHRIEKRALRKLREALNGKQPLAAADAA